jgi:hypothetical protein
MPSCAEQVNKIGRRLRPSRLTARFAGSDLPSFVQVKGSNDIKRLSRNCVGVWVSRNKYDTLGVTLIMLNANRQPMAPECQYDSNGRLMAGCESVYLDYDAINQSDNSVMVTWEVSTEQGVAQYAIQRSTNEAGPFETIGIVVSGDPDFFYEYQDFEPGTNPWYKIVTQYTPSCSSGAPAATNAFAAVDQA